MSVNEQIKRPIHIKYGFFLNLKDDLINSDSDDDSVDVETFSLDDLPHSIDKILSPNYSPNINNKYSLIINHFNDPYEMECIKEKIIKKERKNKYNLIFIFLIIVGGLVSYTIVTIISYYLYTHFIYKSHRW